MTREQLEMTKKYIDDYSAYCKSRECGEGCPVYDEHLLDKSTSCFVIYCKLRESGKISK